MFMGPLSANAQIITAPGPGRDPALTAGETSSSADLSVYQGRWIVLSGTKPFHVRFTAASSTAVATDLRVPADSPVSVYLPDNGGRNHISIIRSGADDSVITIADASDA